MVLITKTKSKGGKYSDVERKESHMSPQEEIVVDGFSYVNHVSFCTVSTLKQRLCKLEVVILTHIKANQVMTVILVTMAVKEGVYYCDLDR